MSISDRLKHFFHVVSNIRPIVWIGIYVAITPLFALIYWALPDGQFRIPDGGTTDFGSWLYYSIVTITTLGFGDYTPMHAAAQAVTAVEVMCGLIFLGFFLNAVGSMKSEIDVASEVEKQKQLKAASDKVMLLKAIPALINSLNTFLAYCYAVTTPEAIRSDDDSPKYNPDFTFMDMKDLFKPSGLPIDNTRLPAAERLFKSASRLSMALDSLQNRVDLLQWPEILEDAFSFVAEYQMFSSEDAFTQHPASYFSDSPSADIDNTDKSLSAAITNFVGDPHDAPAMLQPVAELYYFIKKNAGIAIDLEERLTSLAGKN
ncbi:MAG: potassium channel family protein [Muribaculaceae bacterium]|nr:potassium channel family protein [Muribaculaceae bacterium]